MGWTIMDIGEDDLSTLFRFLDIDDEGEITLQQIVDAFAKTQQDWRIYIMFMKLEQTKMHEEMYRGFRRLEALLTNPDREVAATQQKRQPSEVVNMSSDI